MLRLLLNWSRGVRRISKRSKGKIEKDAAKGFAPEICSSPKDTPEFKLLKNIFPPLWNLRRSLSSFEIFYDSRRVRFILWSRGQGHLKAFVDNLFTLYRDAVFVPPARDIVEQGEYAASATIKAAALIDCSKLTFDLQRAKRT